MVLLSIQPSVVQDDIFKLTASPLNERCLTSKATDVEEVLIQPLRDFHCISANPVIIPEESTRLSQPHSRRREENEDKKALVQPCISACVCFSVGCVWRRSHNGSTSGSYGGSHRSDDGGSNGSANRG